VVLPTQRNERWSIDFVSDQLANGRRFRVLNIVDDFTRECVGQLVDTSISGARMVRFMDTLGRRPRTIVWDNVLRPEVKFCDNKRSLRTAKNDHAFPSTTPLQTVSASSTQCALAHIHHRVCSTQLSPFSTRDAKSDGRPKHCLRGHMPLRPARKRFVRLLSGPIEGPIIGLVLDD
jgi:hypothetical protein